MFHRHDRRRYAFGPFGGRGMDPGFGPRRHGHSPGRRGRRGNTRAAVLALLTERPMHGYEMISELESRTGGMWRPSPGSIYPTLQLLEDAGLIVSEETEGRKRFTLTEAGRAAAAESEEQGHQHPWQEFDPGSVAQATQFREAGFGIMQAMRQIGVSGTEEQRARALEVLTDTRRRLYAILAE